MKKRHTISLLFVALMTTIVIILPSLLVILFSSEEQAEDSPTKQTGESSLEEESAVEVAVYRSASKQTETYPLEEYVAGVIAAEMPAEFEKEALKAQALTARTFIVKQMMNGKTVNGKEAHVTDTVNHQVFKTKAELQDIWGEDFDWKYEKVREAVQETAGQVITYNGEPITASFFSTSNGYTENAEEYWSESLPYLKSVESPWDQESPKYTSRKTMSLSEFESKLGVSVKGKNEAGTIKGRTSGNRIAAIEIGGKELTGREVREKLDLPSSDFSWVLKGDDVVITTKGYGHGVGMSQYGANGMAQEGKDHKDIITHYYQQTEIEEVDQVIGKQITAKK
ncbi:stage II sporulation protein D [Bacillus thermotolerans]|uniref:Stage II sporulation protein D (SpoIID) n=1 Tax=Bacillus thermotolerans TaxID=1221996 RepID=A0A0F5I5R6_BACTR|nr:stage II sporulation protein D [Bacillus thermotolerans]KKB36539.1 Stage II sporulation protein D (SpoIID) [Bacillus thermotolerans]KKB40994.1 Stage II sporulation protein D (SpoIID) [Bacillus thermotolerans]KKB44940.1 Stage II sporulation protein D (SpoIID) [Bacillus thermotolerans]